jgi:hypothetical protein
MNNTEKNFLDNFYNDMNSKSADYKNEDDDIVVYDSFSEIKDKQFMSEESRRNHEIINSHEVFNEEYIYKNFKLVRVDNSNHAIGFSRFVFEDDEEYNNVEENNINFDRLKEAVESESFKLPAGLSIEEKRDYIINFDRIKENLNSELIIMPDHINTPEDIRNFILSHADIQLKNIDDKDKIEVIKSLLDNK